MSTYAERQEKIKHLERDNWGILSTPLISEGNIDPDAISAMSERKKAKWWKDAQAKMALLAEIAGLSRTDEELAQIAENKRRRVLLERKEQAESYVKYIMGLGRMAHKKNGHLKKGYHLAVGLAWADIDAAEEGLSHE